MLIRRMDASNGRMDSEMEIRKMNAGDGKTGSEMEIRKMNAGGGKTGSAIKIRKMKSGGGKTGTEIKIRKMKSGDIAQVSEIEKECFSQPWSSSAFIASLQQDTSVFLVAEEENRLCGYIGMTFCAGEGEITNVAVHPEYRNRGCGAKLVTAMKEYGKRHGVERIILEARTSNATAIHVYQKEGFHTIGIRQGFYEFPKEDAVIMEVFLC